MWSWITAGQVVLSMLLSHTEKSIALLALNKEPNVVRIMLDIVESDKVAYDFVAWHVAVFTNAATLVPQVDDMKRSFSADARDFPGRDEAERDLAYLDTSIQDFFKQKATRFQSLNTGQKIILKTKKGDSLGEIMATSAFKDPAFFDGQTNEMIDLNQGLTKAVNNVNKFLDTAKIVGLFQAVKAVEQNWEVKKKVKGGGPVAGTGRKQDVWECWAQCYYNDHGGQKKPEDPGPLKRGRTARQACRASQDAIRPPKGMTRKHCDCERDVRVHCPTRPKKYR